MTILEKQPLAGKIKIKSNQIIIRLYLVSWYFCTWFERPLSNRTGKSRGGNTWCQIGSQRSFHSIHARLWSINACFAPNRYVQEVFQCLLKKGKKIEQEFDPGVFSNGSRRGVACLLLPLVAAAIIPPVAAQAGVSTSMAFCKISFNVTHGKVSNSAWSPVRHLTLSDTKMFPFASCPPPLPSRIFTKNLAAGEVC